MQLCATLALLLSAVTVTPASVPANGRQEVVVTVDTPSMVHLQTSGSTAPQCVIVDHLRGPFDTFGVAGKTHCSRDLLLDAGTYKVRLNAPTRGKGKITLKASAFTEINHPTPQLEPGRTVDTTLHPTQQASFWVRVPTQQLVTLRVAGRTAGALEVWRDGQWRTDVGATHSEITPAPEQPIHEWWIQKTFEAGDYLVTAYGADPYRWPKGGESDALSISDGFAPAPEERAVTLTIPATGFGSYLLPTGQTAAALTLPTAVGTPTDLSIASIDEAGNVALSGDAQCRVEPRALIPQCALINNTESRHVLMVRGAPGTQIDLQWIITAKNDVLIAADSAFRVPQDGKYLTGFYELMPDEDAAPFSCELEKDVNGYGAWTRIAEDFLQVGSDQPFQRSFNTQPGQNIWFQVADSGRFHITTGSDFPVSCQLVRMHDGQLGGAIEVVDKSPDGAQTCDLNQSLSRGLYELNLYTEKPGVLTLRIGSASAPTGDTPNKATCLLPPVPMSEGSLYRIRTNTRTETAVRRGLLLPAPLPLAEALPVFIEPGHPLPLFIAPGGPVDVHGRGAFTCAWDDGLPVEARDGLCHLPGNLSTALLNLTSKEPMGVSIRRQRPPAAAPPPLSSYAAKALEIPILPLNRPQYFDFERNESRSLLFDVKEAGLYHVETQGLLSTQCALRTAVVLSLATDSGSGRGRNCLLEQYLRPGRYLATVTTTGMSRGRASVSLTRRAPREAEPVGVDSETFFAVQSGDLIEQHLTIPASAQKKRRHEASSPYHLSTTTRGGASLSCRLEDKDGWPILPVPTACELTETLDPGDYLWMQLPMTVESTRHTRLEKVWPPIVFTGKKVHAVVFNEWSDAILRPDGHDEYFINLQADMDLRIALTNRMQGRLYLINPDKSIKPVDIIPPAVTDSAPEPPPEVEQSEEEPADMPQEQEPDPGAEADGEDGEVAPEGDTPTEAPTPPPVPRNRHNREATAPGLPEGHRIHLPAGPYKLIAEHSQADVGVRYRIFVGSDVLAPGFSRELPVPSVVTLRMPQNGTLRLKTSGETDVRCRIFDATGHLVTESSHDGDNWNCALAEPMRAGDYTMSIEDETLGSGTTKVSVEMPPVQDVGVLAQGATLQVGTNVMTGALPPLAADGVQAISFKAPTRFSCAIEDPSGAVLSQQLGVTSCGFLLRGYGTYRARVWTLDQATRVEVALTELPIESSDDGRAKAGTVARTRVRFAGRYSLAANALCLSVVERGLLRPCGPEASLEAGDVLIGALGGAALDEKLSEKVFDDAKPADETMFVSRAPSIQRQHVDGRAIHLLRVSTSPGEKAAPACFTEGGIRALLPSACVSASRVSSDAIARWDVPSDTPIEVGVTRVAAVLPSASTPVVAGKRTLQWSGSTARYALPAQACRIDLTLAPNAWAVRLEADGAVGDLCVAGKGMERCVMSGAGGELVLYSPDESMADATIMMLEALPRSQPLVTLYEDLFAGPGGLRFDVLPGDAPRALEVDGAVHCLTTLADGTRLPGCSAVIPPKLSARIRIEHDAGAVRAVLGSPEQPELARFGTAPPNTQPAWIPWSKAIDLTGSLVDGQFRIDQDSVVHVKAESGVCALVSGSSFLQTAGTGGACEMDRLLKPGTYRVLVRPFGRIGLTGTLAWTTEPVTQLAEGVGPETWIAPSEAKLYTFTTKSPGRVGLGLKVPAETLDCAVLDASQRVLGTGCQQFLQLDAGSYVLAIRAPAGSPPTRFKPVLAGLAGATREVPAEYLRDFFNRIGNEE